MRRKLAAGYGRGLTPPSANTSLAMRKLSTAAGTPA